MKAPTFLGAYSRRFLLATASVLAGAALLAGCAIFHPRVFKTVAGLQLYSVRNQMAKDVDGTLAEVHAWGIKYVELAGTYGLSPANFRAKLAAHDLEAVSGHFSYDAWRDHPEDVIREAHDLGLVYVGCAWIPHSGDFNESACREAIAVFNRAGQIAAQHHMHFFYHTHGYEFQPYKDGTLFDLIMRETNPSNVRFEMDIFWIVHAGQDPVQLMWEYPLRWDLMHLKDMRKDTPTGLLTGGTDVKNDVALGTGKIDLKSILTTAHQVGIEWYFIEDESPDSEEQIPQSLIYLRDLRR